MKMEHFCCGFLTANLVLNLVHYSFNITLNRRLLNHVGAVAISWVKQRLGCEKRFVHLAPFTSKHLGTISIGDRIKDLADCVNLYPAIPKDEAFGKYYTRQGKTSQKLFTAR